VKHYGDFSDKELLSLLKPGDEAAFTEIYNKYWKTLFALAYNRLRDVHVAEDIVHDVFSSLWKNREQSEIDNLPAYLATAVKYMILAHVRKEQRQISLNDISGELAIDVSYDLLESIHNRKILALLNEEVENLPEKCRLIYKYSRNDHKSVKEIAEELNISPSTVENQINKALNRLKIVIKNLNSVFFTLL
jgi:RNA polymerase sigma-70 factor (family 1)